MVAVVRSAWSSMDGVVAGGRRGEELDAEEAGFDQHDLDPELGDLGGESFHTALDTELGGGVGGEEVAG
jgi:hypothetical protein